MDQNFFDSETQVDFIDPLPKLDSTKTLFENISTFTSQSDLDDSSILYEYTEERIHLSTRVMSTAFFFIFLINVYITQNMKVCIFKAFLGTIFFKIVHKYKEVSPVTICNMAMHMVAYIARDLGFTKSHYIGHCIANIAFFFICDIKSHIALVNILLTILFFVRSDICMPFCVVALYNAVRIKRLKHKDLLPQKTHYIREYATFIPTIFLLISLAVLSFLKIGPAKNPPIQEDHSLTPAKAFFLEIAVVSILPLFNRHKVVRICFIGIIMSFLNYYSTHYIDLMLLTPFVVVLAGLAYPKRLVDIVFVCYFFLLIIGLALLQFS